MSVPLVFITTVFPNGERTKSFLGFGNFSLLGVLRLFSGSDSSFVKMGLEIDGVSYTIIDCDKAVLSKLGVVMKILYDKIDTGTTIEFSSHSIW